MKILLLLLISLNIFAQYEDDKIMDEIVASSKNTDEAFSKISAYYMEKSGKKMFIISPQLDMKTVLKYYSQGNDVYFTDQFFWLTDKTNKLSSASINVTADSLTYISKDIPNIYIKIETKHINPKDNIADILKYRPVLYEGKKDLNTLYFKAL